MTTAPHTRPRRFSMIRSFVLADFLTLGERLLRRRHDPGADAVPDLARARLAHVCVRALAVALFFDFADGRVARWRRASSSLGADLDSLADVISFGVAPAALGFAVGLRGTLDAVVLLYFVACGISRLARFNATADELSDESGKVKYFEGTPIPTSVLIVRRALGHGCERALGRALPVGSVVAPRSGCCTRSR